MTTLNNELAEFWAEASKTMPREIVDKIDAGIAAMASGDTPFTPLAVGAAAPDFTLVNQHGSPKSLRAALSHGPVILFFYRGEWCPFCNLQLKRYQEAQSQFAEHGASLIAVTPEKPDHTLVLSEKHRIDFDILHDAEDAVAESFGVCLRIPKQHEEVLKRFGLSLEERNGTANWTLPVPGVFVIDQNAVISAAFVDANYRRRAEPEQILAALESLSARRDAAGGAIK